jgi:FKBP-type peptidyl-prolyl cis-trans isomerase
MFRLVNSVLSSQISFCDILQKETYVKAYRMHNVEFNPLSGGIQFREIRLGDDGLVERSDIINVQFTGKLAGGREIESTMGLTGSAMQIKAGGEGVVKAVSEGVIGMRVYGTRELLVPPQMHYPDRFPNEIMVYEVMVRSIVRKHDGSGNFNDSTNRKGFLSFFKSKYLS